MNEHETKPKDLTDPTFGFSDFRQQLCGGALRWLATVLAIAATGLLIAFLMSKETPEVHFPFHLKGQSVLWVTGGAGLVWLVIAIVNWISWSKRGQSAAAQKH
ncbi:MAG: hypothetical protein RLY20_678 [Verrucomicrobiota bacterium]|jgi:hypothetical protein